MQAAPAALRRLRRPHRAGLPVRAALPGSMLRPIMSVMSDSWGTILLVLELLSNLRLYWLPLLGGRNRRLRQLQQLEVLLRN